MVMASDCGLGGWGSIPSWGKSLTPGFVFKYLSNMMVTTIRIDGCADRSHEQKSMIQLLKTQNNYIRKILFPKFNQG